MTGRTLAHYTIIGKLGEGGMGVVWEARDGHLDRAVALKVLPHDAVANAARKQRFVQEAKAASALNHPHIVTIYDIACADGVDYIAMELIRGRTLEQMLARGRLRLGEALKYGVQIADALAAAHAAGIVHRDLKPGNVMVTERGDVKVLDFGLAKLTDPGEITQADETRTERAVTDEGTVVGSAPYMSPEQAEGRKVDARSDIFSFGSLLYEMLSGKRAFRGANRMATMAAILKEEPEPLAKIVPDLPREVERVVGRCLRKDLDRRSQSMAEIRIALQEFKEESESGSLTATTTAVAGRRRARWPYYAAGALVGVGAIAAAWFFPREQSATPLKATVLTSFMGYQGEPSLSPDGSQFAFTWDGDNKDPHGKLHVYVSLVGKGMPIRVTPEDEFDTSPAWSPDGQSVAFLRRLQGTRESELRVMPALGGPSRKIASGVMPFNSNGAMVPTWSPDSKWLLWALNAHNSVFRFIHSVPAAGGAVEGLQSPPGSGKGLQGQSPAISPDGHQLVWVRCQQGDCDLFLTGFQDGRSSGAVRQLTYDHKIKRSARWTNDGKEIVYLAGERETELAIYRLRVAGGDPQRIYGIGGNAYGRISLAAKGNRLLYATSYVNIDIYRLDLKSPQAKPERFLSSRRYEGAPTYSPDGKRIAFVSDRGGSREIWIANADGADPSPLTSFASGSADDPAWSPDGQFIVFDANPEGNQDIYIAPVSGGPAKRLTRDAGMDGHPSWSPDGKWIYFGSSREGQRFDVFRMRPEGDFVEQITHNGGIFPNITPDGKWLYYKVANGGLWKMPAEGGEAAQVLQGRSLFSYTVATGGTVAWRRAEKGFSVVVFPFDGGKERVLATVESGSGNPAVSPDGHWLLYVRADEPVYEIMRVDDFR